MKELNLEVGQKVWSIQLGECEVIGLYIDKYYPYRCQSIKDGVTCSYTLYGKDDESDSNPSLFESNPFENISTLKTVSQSISKADLINALASVCNVFKSGQTYILASNKLLKLLESL